MSDDEIEGTVRFSSSLYTLHTVERRDVLMQIQGPGAPKKIGIIKAKTIIGRSTDADIQIPSSLVSRQHLSLEREEIDLICRDLDSHNGLLLNGIRVHSVALREGDTLQIGDVVFIYHQGVQWASS